MWKAMPVDAKASSFADEVLSGSTDLCCITKNLTEFLLDRDEETMRFLDKICCVHMPSCTEDMWPPTFTAQQLTFLLSV